MTNEVVTKENKYDQATKIVIEEDLLFLTQSRDEDDCDSHVIMLDHADCIVLKQQLDCYLSLIATD